LAQNESLKAESWKGLQKMSRTAAAAPQKESREKPPKGSAPVSARQKVWREVLSWLWVILAFLFIQSTLVQARVIPSGSMENTLLIGDHLLVSRFGYDVEVPFTGLHAALWREPERQQLIVFRPPIAGAHDFIKRVIGVPGDRIELRGGAVWVNGRVLEEPYVTLPMNPMEIYPYQSIRLGPRQYFVMGDNRGNSYDSRYWGPVPRENIIGTPMFIYMSVDANSDAWQPGHFRERFLAYATAAFRPRLIRWGRLFTAP
jgi:signal peptidase I